jgi:peptidoglycan pentaglycine glycine transferase (the first glycine)
MNNWDSELERLAPSAPLLQSWGFGETQKDEGWRVERVHLGQAQAQVLLQGVAGVSWGYVPRGPVPANEESIKQVVEWARKQRLVRLRVEPEAPAEFGGQLKAAGFRPAVALHPENTLLVPLSSEEEMLASFKPKHRYNIRLAQKKGVTVHEGDDIAELHRQHSYTAARQEISALTQGHYRRRLERLDWCRVYVARVEDEAVAAIMVARFGRRAYYLFGGSSERYRALMPNYLIQWEAMRVAARAGCTEYDLWGVPPSADAQDHPWHGLWQFKAGFGGHMAAYCGAWDMVLAPLGERLADPAGRIGRAISKLVSIY